MKRTIGIITFVICALLLVYFFSIDTCMDAGGSWGNWELICEGAYSDFVPQYKRTAPIFWAMVLFLSGVASLFVSKVVPSAKP